MGKNPNNLDGSSSPRISRVVDIEKVDKKNHEKIVKELDKVIAKTKSRTKKARENIYAFGEKKHLLNAPLLDRKPLPDKSSLVNLSQSDELNISGTQQFKLFSRKKTSRGTQRVDYSSQNKTR